ncbi:hypothetical protein V7S43_005278 [Phytophthora oleae]|uniref:Uncharacterized protein n=1 Tax=Phytophthora oleae TaxID=2107226 RepID=A0ABD3FY65_9STRA
MQMITGDRYDGCELELAKICCKCENDNFISEIGSCHQCLPLSKFGFYRGRVTKKVAMNFYGVKEKLLTAVPHVYRNGRSSYERATLENFIYRTCGSKKEWLKHLVKVRMRREKAEAARRRSNDLFVFLDNREAELVYYVHKDDYKWLDMKDREHWYPRFQALEAAFQDAGLRIELDSKPCKDFIRNGIGSAKDVVNDVRQD